MPNATNAGVSVDVDGRQLNLTVLNLTDLEWLANAMRQEWVAMDPDSESIRAEAFRKKLLSADGFEWLQSTSGMPRFAFRMLKAEHPDVTIQQCYEWVTTNPQPELYKAVLNLYLDNLPKKKGGDADAQKK